MESKLLSNTIVGIPFRATELPSLLRAFSQPPLILLSEQHPLAELRMPLPDKTKETER